MLLQFGKGCGMGGHGVPACGKVTGQPREPNEMDGVKKKRPCLNEIGRFNFLMVRRLDPNCACKLL